VFSWHANFLSDWESPWGACHKAAWLNVTSLAGVVRTMAGDPMPFPRIRQLVSPIGGAGWDEARPFTPASGAGQALSAFVDQFGPASTVGGWTEVVRNGLIGMPRFCTRCLSSGFHSVIHQLAGLDKCPMHGVRLRTSCPACGQAFGDPARLHAQGFACAHCRVQVLRDADDLLPSERTKNHRRDVFGGVAAWAESVFARVAPGLEHIAFDLCAEGHASKRVASFAEAILPLLATRTAPPFDSKFLKASLPQLAMTDEAADQGTENTLTMDVLEEEIETARLVILKDLGEHRACFDGARLLLAAPSPEPCHSNWHGNLCVRAFAVKLWSMRTFEFKRAYRQIKLGTVLAGLRTSLTDLRQDLMSSYHYGMRAIALRRAELKAGVSIANWSVIDMTYDPWLTPGQSLSALGLQYQAAPDLGEYFCDHGAAAEEYENYIHQMWERRSQERKGSVSDDGLP